MWVCIIMLARAADASELGAFALAQAITAPIFMLLSLQLRQVQATDAHRLFSFHTYLKLRLATTALGVATVVTLSLLAAAVMKSAYLSLLALTAARAFDAVSDVFYGRWQFHERLDLVGKSLLLRSAAVVPLVVTAVATVPSSAAAAVAIALSSALILGSYDLHRRVGTGEEELHQVDAGPFVLARTVLPLGATLLLFSLNAAIPKYVLGFSAGQTDVGIFTAALLPFQFGQYVVTAIGQAASPRLAVEFATGNVRGFMVVQARLAVACAAMAACAVVLASSVGVTVLSVVYGHDYGIAPEALTLFAIASGIGYLASALGFGATAAGQFNGQPVVFAIVTAVCFGSSLLFIPGHGTVGAAMALVITSLVQLAGLAVLVLRGSSTGYR